MRILLIEDEGSLAMAIVNILISAQHEVLVSHDGKTTVFPDQNVELTVTEVDLVISDYDVSKAYRFEDTAKLCEKLGTPLILITGRSEEIYKYQIRKPFSKKELLLTIEGVTSSLRKATS